MPKGQTESLDPLWGLPRTAEYLGIPEATLYGWISKGEGPRSYRVGKHRRWKPAEVLEWLEGRASEPRGAA
jgi:excisionase family DNA binding protein